MHYWHWPWSECEGSLQKCNGFVFLAMCYGKSHMCSARSDIWNFIHDDFPCCEGEQIRCKYNAVSYKCFYSTISQRFLFIYSNETLCLNETFSVLPMKMAGTSYVVSTPSGGQSILYFLPTSDDLTTIEYFTYFENGTDSGNFSLLVRRISLNSIGTICFCDVLVLLSI